MLQQHLCQRCSNYIWVINHFIPYEGAPYTRGLTVLQIQCISAKETGFISTAQHVCNNFPRKCHKIHHTRLILFKNISRASTFISETYHSQSKLCPHKVYSVNTDKYHTSLSKINSLSLGGVAVILMKSKIYKLIILNSSLGIRCKIAGRWMPWNLISDKSMLIQVLVWFHRITQQAITWDNVEPDLCHHIVSLGHNGLTSDPLWLWLILVIIGLVRNLSLIWH